MYPMSFQSKRIDQEMKNLDLKNNAIVHDLEYWG